MLQVEPGAPVASGISDDRMGWPWVRPFRPWSLLGMLLRWADVFSELQSTLIYCEHQLSGLDPHTEVSKTGGLGITQLYVRANLNIGKEACRKLNLTVSLARIEGMLAFLYPASLGSLRVLAGDLYTKLRDLRETIHIELTTRLFLFVPTDKVDLYDNVELFGPEVHTRFSKASFDIREAGTCLALGRAMAAVFHLMCVLEVGLDSLASALTLPYSQKNWEQVLHTIEDAISKITSRSDKEFYSRAALEFKFFRDAWRNHTMHGRARYNDEQAAEILEHVKVFMIHLSTRLQERP